MTEPHFAWRAPSELHQRGHSTARGLSRRTRYPPRRDNPAEGGRKLRESDTRAGPQRPQGGVGTQAWCIWGAFTPSIRPARALDGLSLQWFLVRLSARVASSPTPRCLNISEAGYGSLADSATHATPVPIRKLLANSAQRGFSRGAHFQPRLVQPSVRCKSDSVAPVQTGCLKPRDPCATPGPRFRSTNATDLQCVTAEWQRARILSWPK